MECAQINISGGTAKVSPTTYSIPGIYKVYTKPAISSKFLWRMRLTRYAGNRPRFVGQYLFDDIIEHIHYPRYDEFVKFWKFLRDIDWRYAGPGLFSCEGTSGNSPATTSKAGSTTTLVTSTKTSTTGPSATCTVAQWAVSPRLSPWGMELEQY